MKTKYFLITIVWLFSIYRLAAQTIKGQVTDTQTKNSISNATIILKGQNGDYLRGISTDIKGNFKFEYQNERGNFTLEITSIEYEKKIIPMTISKDTTLYISLSPTINKIEEVIVTAEKTATEQLLDKKVINVGKDLLSSGGNALTVLERLPEIGTDSNGNISLKGNKNVNVLINGKPSPLSVAELLRQIPSDNINKIEVTTSPSSKYPASGLTGIINIITHKKVALGFTINTSAGVNSFGGYNENTNMSIGRGKLVYLLGFGYVKNIRGNKSIEKREGLNPFEVENEYKFNTGMYSANGRVDWLINKSNELSFGLNYVDNYTKAFNTGYIFQSTAPIPQNNRTTYHDKTINFTANYKHIFKNPEHYLQFDISRSNNENLSKGQFETDIIMPDNMTNNLVAISRLSSDYTGIINKTITLDAGLLWEERKLENNFSTFDEKGLQQINNGFKNTQTTYASYALLKFTINKFNIQAGLRGEIFSRNANLITDNNIITSNFKNFFPSLHIGYRAYKENVLSFGFNRRTSRPTLNQIDPTINQDSRFEIYRGNPDLKSEFSNNFDITFQVREDKFDLIAGISYRLKEDIILNTISIDKSGANVFRPINAGRSNAFGLDFSFTLNPVRWWNSKLSTNWNYEHAKQTEIFFFRNFNFNYGITFQNDLKLSNNNELDITWQYQGAEKSFISDNNKNQNFAMAFRRKIMKKNAHITLRLSDIFNTKAYGGKDYGRNFVYNYYYKPLSRAVYLSFTYNFKKGHNLPERNIKLKEQQ